MFTFNTLEHVPVKDISNTFNAAFADYLIPFQLNEAQLAAKIRNENIRLDLSAGVFDNNKLTGFILNGYNPEENGPVIYNGGTGVAPGSRGYQLARKLYEYILPRLREVQAKSAILEVMSENRPALHSYQKTGFHITRELVYFKGSAITKERKNEIQIKELTSFDWIIMKSFWSIRPTWQNSPAFIENTRQHQRIISSGAYMNEKLKGYIIYNPESMRILQLAVATDSRQTGIATQLVSYIAGHFTKELAASNVDSASGETIAFFQQLGLKPLLTQYEMELVL